MHAVLEAPAGPIAGHDLIPQLVVIREVTTAIATEDGGGNVLGERPELLGQLFELQLLIPLLRDVVHEVENLHASVVVSTADQERFDPQGRAVGTTTRCRAAVMCSAPSYCSAWIAAHQPVGTSL